MHTILNNSKPDSLFDIIISNLYGLFPIRRCLPCAVLHRRHRLEERQSPLDAILKLV